MNHLRYVKTTQGKRTSTQLWEKTLGKLPTVVISPWGGPYGDFNFLHCTLNLSPTYSTVN